MVDIASKGNAVQASGKTLVNSGVPAEGHVVQELLKTLANPVVPTVLQLEDIGIHQAQEHLLGQPPGTQWLGSSLMEFHLIDVSLQNLAVGNFHVVSHWTEFLYDNTGNPLVRPPEVSDHHQSTRNPSPVCHDVAFALLAWMSHILWYWVSSNQNVFKVFISLGGTLVVA